MTEEKMDVARALVDERAGKVSAGFLAKKLGLSRSSGLRIMHALGKHAYKPVKASPS